MKVYTTQYALTTGIEELDGEECPTNPGMIEVHTSLYSRYLHGEGRQWFRTRESAAKNAENKRLKKIASLEKQIRELKQMTFV